MSARNAPPPAAPPPMQDEEPRFKWFRKTRGGIALTKAEVQYIKAERKKLRKELRSVGLKSKYDFETTAASLGLYFDKKSGFLFWLFKAQGRWFLLAAALLFLLTLLAMGAVTQMRGHFTINLSDGLFRQGFVLSETEDFENPSVNLYAEPQVDVPCISITAIPGDIDQYEGQHNGFGYFAYSYFVRNEGDSAVDYAWELQIVGESLDCSKAAWIMVIQDGEMLLYAEPDENEDPQSVPYEDDSRGYTHVPVMDLASDEEEMMEPIATVNGITYYRINTVPFVDENTVATGYREQMEPQEYHKYTVVVWLEGDDPDCTDDLIGGHVGLAMQYSLIDEAQEEKSGWQKLWDSLKFWED